MFGHILKKCPNLGQWFGHILEKCPNFAHLFGHILGKYLKFGQVSELLDICLVRLWARVRSLDTLRQYFGHMSNCWQHFGKILVTFWTLVQVLATFWIQVGRNCPKHVYTYVLQEHLIYNNFREYC